MLKPLEVINLYPAHDYTLAGTLASRASRDPSRTFVTFADRSWSYQQFQDAVERAATVLVARGITKGDRVGLMGRNNDGHVLMLHALARVGAILVPVNPDFGVEEARYVLNHAQVSGVIAGVDMLETARGASVGLTSRPWFMLLDGAQSDAPLLFDEIAKTAPGKLPGDVSADDICLIVYTSGTTGFPKGAMHAQRSFVTGGEAFVQRVYLQPEDRVMVLLPLFHINAMFYSVAGTLAAGCNMVIVPKFSASTFWQTVVDTGATQVNIIEAVGSILKNRPRTEFRPNHTLRCVYGVRQGVYETFGDEFKVPNRIGGYGMTEIPGVTCQPYEGPWKPGSMGPVGRHPDPAKPWAVARVVDDEGRDVPDGTEGELWVKTPIVMKGYYRDPEQTAGAFDDGWFKTGDLVKRDAEGYFYFISRKKDIIRRRGENIAGAELDRVIGNHPGVLEVAAIAVPSELGEDEILAAIVKRPDVEVTASDIAAHCREHLAPMKVPRYVLFVDSLPYTPTHKIAKAQLRADKTIKDRAVDLQPSK